MALIPSAALAIALLLLALEKFGMPIPPILTGIFLLIAALVQFA